jgi:uncharacterized protein (TIGR02594 family)
MSGISEQPRWMRVALGELGVREVPGGRHEARILEYHAATHLHATTDEVAWCSSFANFCMSLGQIEPTRSAAARSWLSWGDHIDEPRFGCVVVFDRSSPEQPGAGHVAFYVGETLDKLAVLGGNQGNEVKVALYPKLRVLGYRWPKGVL